MSTSQDDDFELAVNQQSDELNKYYGELGDTHTSAVTGRELIERKLRGWVEDVNIDPNYDKPSEIEARLLIVDRYAHILGDQEKSSHEMVKAHQKKALGETVDNMAEDITSILEGINTNGFNALNDAPDLENAQESAEKAFEASKDIIREGELRENSDDV